MNGPVDFTIEEHGGYLHYGNVAARVPPAAMSFTIKTPKVQVVDFGTEFGVHAEKDGQVDVHVFQGQVQAWQVRGDGTIDRRIRWLPKWLCGFHPAINLICTSWPTASPSQPSSPANIPPDSNAGTPTKAN